MENVILAYHFYDERETGEAADLEVLGMKRSSLARIYIVVVMILVFSLVMIPGLLNRNRVEYVELPGIKGVIPEDIWNNEKMNNRTSPHAFYGKTNARKLLAWGIELSDMVEAQEVHPFRLPEAEDFQGMDADAVFQKIKEVSYLYYNVTSEIKEDLGDVQLRQYVSTEMTDKGPRQLYSVIYVDGDYIYWQGIMIADYELSDKMQEVIRKDLLKNRK